MQQEEVITMTQDQLQETIQNTVRSTLCALGFIAPKGGLSPYVKRSAVLKVISRSRLEKAIRDGKLHPIKEDLESKSSPVKFERREWEKFYKASVTRYKVI